MVNGFVSRYVLLFIHDAKSKLINLKQYLLIICDRIYFLIILQHKQHYAGFQMSILVAFKMGKTHIYEKVEKTV